MTEISDTPTASRKRQAEAQGQERDEEHAAAESEERPEDAGGRAAADHQQPDDHVRRSATAGGCDDESSERPAQGRRCCGAYGRRATWRARLSATASSRWCPAQVPVLRRGSILARSDR